MDTISRLRTLLLGALGSCSSQYGEQDLFDELMVNKLHLLKLFDVGPRNTQEQREIESGKTVVNGDPIAVNSDFARQVVFLSQQLECSERYVAGLLHTIMAENPNFEPVNWLELTVVEFHTRRRHLVECLLYLFEASEAAESMEPSPLIARIDAFVLHDLIPAVPWQGGEISLAYRIFKEIENLDNVISKTDVARKNAGSNTTAPLGQGTPSLGCDILNARYDSLKFERRQLATVLCLIARLGHLSPNEIKSIIDWLSLHPVHPVAYYMLTTVLAAFDSVEPQSRGGRIRKTLATERGTLTFMSQKLGPAAEWRDPGLKATVLLKWTLFLTEARHREPNLEHREGFKTEELETQVWNAVQGGAFSYLATVVLQLHRSSRGFPSASFANSLIPSSELQEHRDIPPDDFKSTMLFAFESLVRSLITHASSELRKIKQRQEDLVLASAHADRTRSSTARFPASAGPESDNPPSPAPRNDIAMLYSFIGLLYTALPPERALQFWGSGPQGDSYRLTYMEYIETTAGKLPAFLQWAVWSTQGHDITMSTALYDMLAGLAKGQQCSELAYNFMARGAGEATPGSMLTSSSTGGPSVSWSVMFGLLESWASIAANTRSQGQSLPLEIGSTFRASASFHHHPPVPPHQVSINPKDVLLAQSFLRLLSTVVTHSVAVRLTISGHTIFRAIPTLVSLIPLGIPLELKGALFETLAAFCEPGAGIPGIEICKAVWTLMERLEVINVRVGPVGGFGAGLAPVKGVEVELDEIETVHRMYPATIPFLKLLCTLIHTPKRVPLKARVADTEPINTIPESLGQPYRLPGIGPFTCFVIDNVFSKISNREYLRPSDRWQTNDLCLCFIERVLASFDLESLINSGNDAQPKGNSIIPVLVHPGYDVMKRLLTNSALQASLLSYIVEGVEGFEKELAEEEPFFRSTIIRVLRIVHRILEIQDIFLDVLVPLLSEFDSAAIVGTVHSRSYFIRFDQALSFGPQYIPALAAYVAYPAHPELVLLSIKIITVLSLSTILTNLTSLIEQSDDSERILSGFVQIMNTDSQEDILTAEDIMEQTTGAGASQVDNGPASLNQGIRLAALDLLIQNTEPGRPFPNVAHFLLFGTTTSEQQIQDPHALGARHACVHILLDLLNTGVPRLKERDKNQPGSQATPLFISLPELADRCYRVIHQLCVHPRSSDSTMRYLRTREDFFARQLAAIPSRAPENFQEPYIQVLYNDGSRITTNVPSLSSFLRLRSRIFDLVALDLHILTNKGHHKGVSELLDILFGNAAGRYEGSTGWEDGTFQPFREVGQSYLRIIEFVQSLNFDWSDSLTVQPIELQFLGQLNLHSCVRTDATGCEVVDRTALLSLITAAKRALHAQSNIVTATHLEQLNAETTYILESCAVENHRREVTHATASGYEAWKRLLDMALTKCFTRLPRDRRENMLFDLLHVLPAIIRSTNTQESTAVQLSETVLSSITKLREDRRHQIIIQSAGGDAESSALPVERLHSILRSILECILDNNHVELVRGNLYAALINYLHLISSDGGPNMSRNNLDGLFMSVNQGDSSFSDSQSLASWSHPERPQTSASSIIKGSLALMKGVMERLTTVISRDAIDGSEVWQAVAFMLLDALVQLSSLEKQHIVLSALVRHGILSNFVGGLKQSDLRLQSVLKPDPDDLNPLYVYEAKMSFFIRMTQTRSGAERLLEAQLIPVLAKCDYLDARPEADQSFMEQDTFLPSAIQRYHQLFMPALQLVEGMLATLGANHATVSNQALDFLSGHSATIVILLKNLTDDISLAFVEEVHLLVSLCGSILPSVPKPELLSRNSGFGAIHAAILSLSTRILGNGSWARHVKPNTEAELLSATVFASRFGSSTKFDSTVRRKEHFLRKGIVAYIGSASEFTEPEIALVLSPVTTIPRHDDRGSSHFLATVPTIGDTLEALDDLCTDLADTLKQIANISAELASKEQIGVDHIQEIVSDADDVLHDLDIGQRRSLISRELENFKNDAESDAKILLNTLEMLLLLLWRHLAYYSDGHDMSNPSMTTSSMHTMRFLAAPEPEAFRVEVGKKLAPILQRLASLNLAYESLGSDGRASQGYVEIMCRRLRDSAGLHDGVSSPNGT